MDIISLDAHKRLVDKEDPLNWFLTSLKYEVYYYEEVEDQFTLLYDKTRWVDGTAFQCNLCGRTATWVRMDAAELHRTFIVVKIICVFCGNRWRKEGVKPLYETVLESYGEVP